MKQTARLLIVAASLLSFGVSAQWLWVDKDGRKVFSDRVPPADVPEKSILKRPGQSKASVMQEAVNGEDAPRSAVQGASATPARAGVSAPRPAGVDKELADRKKKAEQAEAAKRKAEEDKIRQAKADSCERAKVAKTGLDSGARIARVNKQGEREVMDDAARASEAKRVQAIIDSECK